MKIYYHKKLLFQELKIKSILWRSLNLGMNRALKAVYFIGTLGHLYFGNSGGHFADILYFIKQRKTNYLFGLSLLYFNNVCYSTFDYKVLFCYITAINKTKADEK